MDKDTFNNFMVEKMKIDEILETMFKQIVRIFKEEYANVYKDAPQ